MLHVPGPLTIPERPPAYRPIARHVAVIHRLGAVEWFVIFQFACQLGLIIPGIGPLRLILRCAAFGASLGYLFIGNRRGARHPSSWAALAIMVILALCMLNPMGNTIFSQVAQVGLYVAILAPLFWVPRLKMDRQLFRRVILIFWTFHALSAGVGALQVYFPGRFQPPVSTVIEAKGQGYVESLKIKLSNGQEVFRPMGLTDQPGGAAMSGLYTVLFGIGLLLTESSYVLRGLCCASIAMGLFCLYLAQVRSVFVMTGVCAISFCGLLTLRGDFHRLIQAGAVLAALVFVSFIWAVSLGGDVVTKRLTSLVTDRADNVYYKNRGHFLDETIHEMLPQYPFGAGLGRWGMMNTYFGDRSLKDSSMIWVEIQWTAWLLDGGVPLILAYVTALVLAFVVAWKVSFDRKIGSLGVWGSLLFAYNLAAIAMTFNYPLFIGQSGLEFWLLNACLFAAWRVSRTSAEAPV